MYATGRFRRAPGAWAMVRRPNYWPNPPLLPGNNYTIPVGAVSVSTVDQLATELAKTTAEDIKVLNGTYSRSSPLASPGTPTFTPATTGGSLSNGTYTYAVTAINAQGETLSSAEASVTLSGGTATQRITVSWSAVTGATGYRVYGRSGTGVALKRLPTQPTGTATTVSDTGATVVSTTTRPTRNTTSGYIQPAGSHRIFCETYDGVTFDFGFQWGNRLAWQQHGGRYLITDAANAAVSGSDTFAIGNFQGLTLNIAALVSNVYAEGPDPASATGIGHAVFLGQPDDCIVQRVDGQYFTRSIVTYIDNHSDSVAVADRLWDVRGRHVYANPRGSLNGAYEFIVLMGNNVLNGVHRIAGYDTGIGGLQTISKVEDTDFADMDFDSLWGYEPVDPQNVHVGMVDSYGLYIERWTRRCVFRRFRIGSGALSGIPGDVNRAINNEWNYNRDFKLSSSYTIGSATMLLSLGNMSNMPTAGTVYIGNTSDIESTTLTAVNYTGKSSSPLSLTGCSGGSGGPYASGSWVSSMPGGYASSHSCIYKEGVARTESQRGAISPATIGSQRPGFGLQFDQGVTHPIVRDVRFQGRMDLLGVIVDHTGMPAASDLASSQMLLQHCDFGGKKPITYEASNV
jgi:hypothetical protein